MTGAGSSRAAPRDPYAAVRAFLADADVRPEFAARALARIEAQHADLGDGYLWAALDSLVTECAEETEDLAAWSAIIAARLEHSGSTDGRARAFLIGATQRAAQADEMLSELRRLVVRP
ncbi:MAG: hypothetical protein ACR2KV_14090 [Solirubrobacteraceae bacterium]